MYLPNFLFRVLQYSLKLKRHQKSNMNFYIFLSSAVVEGDVLIMDDRKITGNPINQAVY